MRLTMREVEAIKAAAVQHFGQGVEVYLFGSRVDDKARGGDIDLYLELPAPVPDKVRKSCQMYADLQLALGEQKIDIVVWDPESPPLPIHQVARETGVRL